VAEAMEAVEDFMAEEASMAAAVSAARDLALV
jgi:hypothetical protein